MSHVQVSRGSQNVEIDPRFRLEDNATPMLTPWVTLMNVMRSVKPQTTFMRLVTLGIYGMNLGINGRILGIQKKSGEGCRIEKAARGAGLKKRRGVQDWTGVGGESSCDVERQGK